MNLAPFVYVVEEAHNLLSSEMVREESVFVDFAKTGRSFRIGLVAITQQPSSVDPKITSQFDNYITLRLMSERDVKDLVNATSAFDGYESEIRSLGRSAALAVVDEVMRVQSVQVFEWTDERSKTLLTEEQAHLLRDLFTQPLEDNRDLLDHNPH